MIVQHNQPYSFPRPAPHLYPARYDR
jgi:hypothetical protein